MTNTSVVRYDAYQDAGGQQSASFAFLDSTRSRHGRDGDPGPRLRTGLRQGARARAAQPRPLARGGGGRRARDGAVARDPRHEPSAALLHSRRESRARPERELRAAERVLDTSRARARLEGQGRGGRAARRAPPDGDEHLHAASRDPARGVRSRAAVGQAAHLAPRALRPRRLALRLLRRRRRAADARPRRAALARRRLGWENVVTACAPCNLRKGDRLLEETQMHLARPPRAPSPVLFISLALHRVPDAGCATSRRPRRLPRPAYEPDGHRRSPARLPPSSRSAR